MTTPTDDKIAVSYMRQTAILDPVKASEKHISILGAGTVGSNIASQCARAGFKRMHFVDMDVVEEHNLPSQAFSLDALGMNKADALKIEVEQFADQMVITTQDFELMGGEQFEPGVIVCAVDNMEMRKTIFELSAQGNPNIDLFIDFRMGGNNIKAYCFDPNDKKRCKQYADSLYTNEEAEPIECGGRTFAPVGALVGALGTQMITKYLREEDHPPFRLEIDFDRFDFIVMGLPKLEETD